MIPLSTWFLAGFALGALAGTLVTDLTREDIVHSNTFKPTLRFWQWSQQQSLVFVVLLWASLLVVAIISRILLGTSQRWNNLLPWDWWKDLFAGGVEPKDWWKQLLLGSIIGAAAAPWVWLHFVRSFGTSRQQELAAKDALIKARAHQIWLESGRPDGRADEHYAQATKEIEDAEQLVIEASTKSAEQQLARYRLVSILFGIALLVVTLLPVLQSWLRRAQEFSAFGVSLTLIATQPGSQNRGTPVVGATPNASNGLDATGEDRLLSATTEAYRLAAPNPKVPLASLHRIGPALNDFRYLSVIDRDRAFIAWLTFEQPEGVGELRRLETSGSLTLAKYVEEAEHILQENHNPDRWVDPDLDWAFAADSTYISKCLLDQAKQFHDPHFFTVEVSHFLRRFVHEVYKGGITNQLLSEELLSEDYPLEPSGLSDEGGNCNYVLFRLAELDVLYRQPSSNAQDKSFPFTFKISPYPSLVTADYLAAIGAVDTGVLVIQDWIKDFYHDHKDLRGSYGPQLEWYLLRAKLSAVICGISLAGLRWRIESW
jgi:hypothetical protein